MTEHEEFLRIWQEEMERVHIRYEWMHFSWATSQIVNGYVDEGWELYSEYTDPTNGNNWIVNMRRIRK